MVKIEYIGDRSPIRVKVKGITFNNLSTGDIIEMDESHAAHILINKSFKRLEEEHKVKKKVEKKEEINYDLDGDGDFDKDDVSIAGKVLAGSRKIKE